MSKRPRAPQGLSLAVKAAAIVSPLFVLIAAVGAVGYLGVGSLRLGAGLVMGAAVLVGSVEVVLLVRFIDSITRPVRTLESAVATLTEGDLTQPLPPIDSTGEIGRLSRGFDAMVAAMTRLVREIVRASSELQENSAQLAHASEEAKAAALEVALAVDRVAMGAAQQVSDVGTAGDRIRAISTAARSLAANVRVATDNSSLMAEVAAEGRRSLDDARFKMEQAERTVLDTTGVVRRLADMGKSIGQISDLIATFAKKTNFLALNAGVEAARAGEDGRGFGVLAVEIRKLAIESGQAARQIASMVETIQAETAAAIFAMDSGQQEVASGVGALGHLAHALERIVEVVGESEHELDEIWQISGQVASSADQMVTAMESVVTISEETAEGAQHVFSAAEQQNASAADISLAAQTLAQLATDLKDLVGHFKVAQTL